MSLPIRSARIHRGLEVRLEGVREETDLDAPQWAVNWFDTRFGPLYTLYTQLAGPVALHAGAQLHFKGRRLATLCGAPELARDRLLLVRWPRAEAFLDLVQSRFFQAVSVLRVGAVRRFCFGFVRRIDAGPAPRTGVPRRYRGGAPYLVVVLDGKAPGLASAFQELCGAAPVAGLSTHFAGLTQARVQQVTGGGRVRNAPFPIRGLAVFSGPDRRALEAFAHGPAVRSVASTAERSLTAIFRRDR